MDRSPTTYLAPLAVVAAAGALYGFRLMHQRRKPRIAAPEAAFDSALLILSVPSFLDPKTIIRNDELLAKAVKQVKKSLHVVLNFPELTSTMLSYASDIYATLWDIMLETGNTQLDCRVYTNTNVVNRLASAVEVVLCDKYSSTMELCTDAVQLSSFVDSCSDRYTYVFVDTPAQVLKRYARVAMGGTFDNLHNGHKRLLTIAAAICTESLTVGVTDDSMLRKKKHAAMVQKFDARMAAMMEFVNSVKDEETHIRPVRLLEGLGPPATEEHFDALLASSETLQGAIMINEAREKLGFKPLDICICRRQAAATLSSTFIRERQALRASGM